MPDKNAEALEEAMSLMLAVQQIEAVIAGLPHRVQMAIVGEMAATWIVGHEPRARASALRILVEHITERVPALDRELFPDGWNPDDPRAKRV